MTRMLCGRQLAVILACVAATALSAGQPSKPKPRITILTTGGTIASRGGAPMQAGAALIAAIPQLAEQADITVEEIVRVGSSRMTPSHWLTLSKRINALFREQPPVPGVVVTHGTDTLEETAFFLNLTVRGRRPVVVTGSMRTSDEPSADGPANLLNAVRTATSEDAVGRGVLVVLNESIAAARDVWKTHNRRVDTFRSPELGLLGYADPDGVVFYRSPARPHTGKSEFDISELDALPNVALVSDYTGFDATLMDGLITRRPAGLVVASFAGGRLSEGARDLVRQAAAAGIPVVVASRVPGGRIVGNAVSGLPAVVARDLSPNKARILLMLALTRTRNAEDIQRIFDTY